MVVSFPAKCLDNLGNSFFRRWQQSVQAFRQSQTMMPPPLYFTVGGFDGGLLCLFSLHIVLCVPSKQLFWFHPSTEHFARNAVEHPGALLQTSKVQQCIFFYSNGSLRGALSWIPLLFDVLLIVDLATIMLACAKDFCKFKDSSQGFFFTTRSILRCALSHLLQEDHTSGE